MVAQHFPYQGFTPDPSSQIAAFVRSSGPDEGDGRFIRSRMVTTLNAGLSKCRSGKGDVVVVMSDHAENISSADQMSNLVAGTRIVGLGRGNLRPTFTWTAATATFLIDVANVTIENCIFEMAGNGTDNVTVAAPMTISAAGFTMEHCRARVSIDANKKSTIAFTTTAAADDMSVRSCTVTGATAGEVTTCFRLVGADRFRMEECYVDAATSSTTVGVLQFLTTASTQVYVWNCCFANRKAASVHAATGMAGATGCFVDCNFLILDNATAAGLETEGNLSFFQCQVANAVGEQGITKTPVSV